MMELRVPTLEELRQVYHTDMKAAFPPAELKPLSAIERMWEQGGYRPYCLYEDDTVIGVAFLWLGHPGWALLDYLCVTENRRNDGLGARILQMLLEAEPEGTVIFGESEAPVHAPDPAMAKRRLGFYARCGLRTAAYDTEIFGVHYKTLYLAKGEVSDEALMKEHQYVYRSSFTPEKYDAFIRIPRDPDAVPGEKVAWEQ